ncbi:hypothetical protein [Flavobacterium sp. HJSW_4]|uniref:hypothetical protein n=1 Tax=Flavobacterium sp. HJSW_4 TaxID=3344660 RepID=UPI0035F4895D
MISINSQIIENIFIDNKIDIDNLIISRRASLSKFLISPLPIINLFIGKKKLNLNQINYLYYLHSNFEKIVRANSLELEKFKKAFDAIIPVNTMRMDSHKAFRNKLIDILGYKILRDNFYPDYFEKIGIRSCVYCNSQYALTVRKVDGIKCAKFQIDHFLSKSDYPCFSISFYNLYPVCGSCNNSKSTKTLKFKLYSDSFKDYNKSDFKFLLDKKSLLKYRVNGIDSELKIIFNDGISDFNNVLAVEGIYNTQKDIAEEIVLKSMIYNRAYTDSLRRSLEKLYHDKSPMIERLLVGNYLDEKDIHKRPMAKFIQDIAKQLKLI